MPFDIPGSPSTRPLPASHEVPKFKEEHKPADEGNEVHISPPRGLVRARVGEADAPRVNAQHVTAQDVCEKFLNVQVLGIVELEQTLGRFLDSLGDGKLPSEWSASEFVPLLDVIKAITGARVEINQNRVSGKLFASRVIPMVLDYSKAHPAEDAVALASLITKMQGCVCAGLLQEFHDGDIDAQLEQRFRDAIASAREDKVNGPENLRMMAWNLQRPRKKRTEGAPEFAAKLFEDCLIAACQEVIDRKIQGTLTPVQQNERDQMKSEIARMQARVKLAQDAKPGHAGAPSIRNRADPPPAV
jgi:hypothetical protein